MTTTLDTQLLPAVGAAVEEAADGVRALTCIGREPIAPDVVSFHFRPADGLPFYYEAGQYVTVMAIVDGREVSRCFSLSSSPSRPGHITITVKRKHAGPTQEGIVSTWLHERIGAGDEIRVIGPLGDFTAVAHPGAKYAFVSAGSGITPLMSMTRWLRDMCAADIAFVHSAHTDADVIFRAELDELAAAGAAVHTVLTDEGRLNPGGLTALVPDLAGRELFVCGPAGFRQMVLAAASAAGIDPARCHTESFAVGTAPEIGDEPDNTDDPLPRAATTYSVAFLRSGRTIECPSDMTVLAAALREGPVLASSCTEGMCGTCKSTMVSGSVDMHHQGGIRPKEIAANKFLPCCSKPTDDLVIDA